MKNERGSISLFVLLSALFFLVVVTSVGVSLNNKETRIDAEFAKIKASYEKDIGNEEQIYMEKTNNEENVDFLTDNDYLIVMASSKSKFEGKSNVGTIEEFKTLVNSGNFNYENAYLYEDIDLNCDESNPWTSIGTDSSKFYATLDGKNHEINGLYVSANENYQGLFRISGGTIKNLTINGQITGTANGVGALAGQNNGIIENCTVNVTVTGAEYVGGVVGYNSATGAITNCTSNNNVLGTQIVGGIAGGTSGNITGCTNSGIVESTSTSFSTINSGLCGTAGIAGIADNCTISNSRNLNNVTSAYLCVGGIAGTIVYATVTNCYNDGEIYGNSGGAGGIVGFQKGTNSSTKYCYNINRVESHSNIGGIVGDLSAGNAENCYNIGQVETYQQQHLVYNMGGICGRCLEGTQVNNCYTLDSLSLEVVGIPADNTVDSLSKNETEQNMKANSFVSTLNSGETHFKTDYSGTNSVNNGFPILTWQ